MNTRVMVAIRMVGRATWIAAAAPAILLREFLRAMPEADGDTDGQLHDTELFGECNYRTGRLDAGNDPYGWYDED